jgi:hypothetical protein
MIAHFTGVVQVPVLLTAGNVRVFEAGRASTVAEVAARIGEETGSMMSRL